MLVLFASAVAGVPVLEEPLRTGAKAPDDAAVVVGIEDYAFLPDVPFATRDAAVVYDRLLYTVGVASDRVALFDASDPTTPSWVTSNSCGRRSGTCTRKDDVRVDGRLVARLEDVARNDGWGPPTCRSGVSTRRCPPLTFVAGACGAMNHDDYNVANAWLVPWWPAGLGGER